jgi:sugar/nucleoside kinase (ribokinase family)
MILSEPFTPPAAGAVAVGIGRLTLDVIVRSGGESVPARCQAGGTCGNVLANLAYLGWQAYPLMDLGDDDPGTRFVSDMQRWGVQLDLVRRIRGERTPVIIHYIRYGDGEAVHSYSSRCPFCGERLRYYEPVPTESVRQRLPLVPAARVIFFDRDSEGALLLARQCAEQGAVVVFEPNYAGKETLFPQAVGLAHILKYARDKLPDLEEREDLSGPLLLIETQGAEGLRYRDRRHGPGAWRHLPAVPAPVVRDAGGSGDWCTAGLLHRLGQEGLTGLLAAPPDDVREALRFGQALAAWGCAFEGARGAVYHGDRSALVQGVNRLSAGGSVVASAVPALPAGGSAFEEAGAFCPRCGGEKTTEFAQVRPVSR